MLASKFIQELVKLGEQNSNTDQGDFLRTVMPVVGVALFDTEGRHLMQMSMKPLVSLFAKKIEDDDIGDDESFKEAIKHVKKTGQMPKESSFRSMMKPDMKKLIESLIKPENRSEKWQELY
jgi:hypothetical protein